MAPPGNLSIEVRNLDGESMNVAIAENASISDLRNILKNSFRPAKNLQNFHLFYKGSKMSLNSRLDSHNISKGEIIVLVPYAKKSQHIFSSKEYVEESTPSPLHSNKSTSDSAWLDIMEDLSSLPHTSNSDKEPLITEAYEEPHANIKRKRNACNEQSLHDILSSDSEDIFDQKTRNDISQLVGLVNCLMDSKTGKCMLFEKFGKKFEMESCLCPLWLKKLIKCFRVLNILYAFSRAQQQPFTWRIIEKVLENSSSFGLDNVCVSDIENVSILCPKLVVILKGQTSMEIKPGSAIIIDDSSGESSAPCEPTSSCKIVRQRTSTLVNAIEKRENAFRNGIQKLIMCTLKKGDNRSGAHTTLSLNSLTNLIKNGTSGTESNDLKSAKPKPDASRCQGMESLGPSEMVDHLREGIGIDGQIVHIEYIDAKEAVYVDLPDDLSDNCRMVLKRIGISKLYCHQAEAIKASLSGKNTIVATSTSSGKSLCYNVPVLEALSQNSLSCALYIFPTKALAQDQLRALLQMTNALDVEINIGVYDGDTFQDKRTWIRDNARLLITNPDMLHTSILPYHKNFHRFLSNLRTIVVDEAHVYKGAFGCHTALVLRRLRRICSHVYGSEPSFIFSTATSANPCEHAMELANLHSLELIQNDGSPSSEKYFLLWNPPLRLGSNLGKKHGKKHSEKELCLRRSSPILEASRLFAEMVRHGLRCITFCKTRKLSELVLSYTREILQESCQNLVDSICVYRGGYTPEERRNIEGKFFGGNLLGIAATNALELGIDVGQIDATLHLGFPGSVSSLWQQAGRSGRRSRPSLAIYIAFEGPLDQYFMKFPHKLFKRPIEHCQVDGKNQEVLEQHVACAAVELPLCTEYDEKYFGPGLANAISCLKNKGILISEQPDTSKMKMWNYIGSEEKPSIIVSLRAIESDRYKVIEQSSNEILEEIEESKAFFQVYEGAVYMHQGFTYLVKTLDLSEKVAYCQRADVKYYTKTRDSTTIHITGGNLVYPLVKKPISKDVKTTAQVNPCKVTTRWFGFHRVWKSSNDIYDTVKLQLPDFTYDSQAVWIRVSQSIKEDVEKEGFSFRAGLHAASHALLNTVPLYVMCNTSDLSTECVNPHETRSSTLGRLLLYDKHPGGIGLMAQVQVLFKELLVASQELVSGCSCSSNAGCPNCVQALLCSEYNEVLDKQAAIIILKGVIESEDAYFKSRGEFGGN